MFNKYAILIFEYHPEEGLQYKIAEEREMSEDKANRIKRNYKDLVWVPIHKELHDKSMSYLYDESR